ncbi:MAG: hypothetical protein JWP97_4028 [Labilithrix sp.]|nr:hypothetical protein [Labilithrix sp.]
MPVRFRRIRSVAVVLFVGAVAAPSTALFLACGPSFQAVYEGNAQFEHCYAMEERAQIAVHEKAECWNDWSQRYTYGQTRDRINYATARYVALSQDVPTDEAMMMAAPGMTPRTSIINAPSPTNAFAPPPKVLDQADAGTGKPSRPSEKPVIVGDQTSSVDAGDGGRDGGDAGVLSVLKGTPASAQPAQPAPAAPRTPPQAGCIDACASTFRSCSGAPATCDQTYRTCVKACVAK